MGFSGICGIAGVLDEIWRNGFDTKDTEATENAKSVAGGECRVDRESDGVSVHTSPVEEMLLSPVFEAGLERGSLKQLSRSALERGDTGKKRAVVMLEV